MKTKQDSGMATDPVCGMNVEEQLAADKLTHEGTVYYFCSAACLACEQRSCRRYEDTKLTRRKL